MIVDKPWGYYRVFSGNEKFWHKLIFVSPGERLSLQVHAHRDEFWEIESGYGSVRIGDDIYVASVGQTFFIPRGTKHRIHNSGHMTLTFSEVAMGDVHEDDIVRLEDDFGRA
jgi:mannose-1-phosphate guanylyltransferase/mannose-6-phosphate isomerase